MAKISLTKPVSGYNLAAINDNFTALEAEFQDKVLYRDNPVGEPNTLETDLDLNGNDILNAGTLNGVPIADLSDISSYVNSAAASAASAAASYDSFDDRYLGSKAVAPTLDNDGNALITGALYWDSVGGQQYTWNGSAWVANSVPGGVVAIASGGTGSTTAANARTSLGAATAGALGSSGITGAAASGANTDITSLGSVSSMNGGALAGFRNRIINGNFGVNQRGYVSGATVGTNLYGHDRWKMAASGDTYTFSTTANVTTVTIPAGKVLQQVIEGLNLETGTYTLSWSGTAQGKIGAGSYGASGVSNSITGGTNTTIEFGPGTVSKVQLEFGSVVSVFEQRPYGTELSLCQRYCFTPGHCLGTSYSTTAASYGCNFPVVMRAAPSANASLGVANGTVFNTGSMTGISGFSINTLSPQFARFSHNYTAVGSAGMGVEVQLNGSFLAAEL